MSAVFGVQPAAARILIDGGATGFTQRFLWTSMGLEQRPVHDFAHRVDWPLCEISIPDRAWSNWCDTYRTGDITGVNPRRIRLTPAMERAVEDAQWELQREGSTVDPLDAHVVQLTERVAAILSIIEAGGLGECVVTQGAWDRAAYIIRHSREARTACFNAYAKACSEAETRRLAIQGVASDAARAHVIDQRVIRCKRCIIKKLWFTAIASGRDLEPDNIERAGLMADTVGVMGNRLRHGLARDLRDEVWQKAMDDLTDDGVVIPVGTARPGDPYTSIAWTVDAARVPDDVLPAGAKR